MFILLVGPPKSQFNNIVHGFGTCQLHYGEESDVTTTRLQQNKNKNKNTKKKTTPRVSVWWASTVVLFPVSSSEFGQYSQEAGSQRLTFSSKYMV